jgi:hypothetical protein
MFSYLANLLLQLLVAMSMPRVPGVAGFDGAEELVRLEDQLAA